MTCIFSQCFILPFLCLPSVYSLHYYWMYIIINCLVFIPVFDLLLAFLAFSVAGPRTHTCLSLRKRSPSSAPTWPPVNLVYLLKLSKSWVISELQFLKVHRGGLETGDACCALFLKCRRELREAEGWKTHLSTMQKFWAVLHSCF